MLLIIVRQGVRCCAMQNKTRGVMDFLQSIRIVGKMIREFKLKVVSDSIPEFRREAVTFDRKIKRSDLNVVISCSRLSTCPGFL